MRKGLQRLEKVDLEFFEGGLKGSSNPLKGASREALEGVQGGLKKGGFGTKALKNIFFLEFSKGASSFLSPP